MLTIGQLARRVGLRPSALRYYEAEGLLSPSDRTEAGYRLYDPAAADTLRLIQRAQRLGFSLAEIRALLAAWQTGNLDDAALLATAEARYLALERQITEWRVQQHELELFLQDLRGPDAAAAQTAFGRLVDRICANPTAEPPSRSVLDWLAAYSDCPPVSYTHLRAHETVLDIVCRLLLEKNNKHEHRCMIDRQLVREIYE